MSTATDYDAACDRAAAAQGLNPLLDRLTEERIPHNLAQTGGFNMAVTVGDPEGTWAMICDGPEPKPWVLAWYPGTAWDEGDGSDVESTTHTLDDLVEALMRLAEADR